MTTKTTIKRKPKVKPKAKKKTTSKKDVVDVVVQSERKSTHKYFEFNEPGEKGGRPSLKFDLELLNELFEEYIGMCGEFMDNSLKDPEGKPIWQKKLRIPMVEDFSEFLEVDDTVLYNWMKESPEFSNTMGRLKKIQKILLINGGASGTYRENFARFLLTVNHDMVDESKVDNTHKMIGINYVEPEQPKEISEPEEL